jgi:hypothetical protein
MVNPELMLTAAIFQAQAARPVWFRLPPENRVTVLFALAVLLFLGFAFAAFTWWAGRWTRRYMNRPPRSGDSHVQRADDWAAKPLLPNEEPPSSPKD